MQIFIRNKERGTIGLDPRFHELMGEMLDWFFSTGQREGDLKSEDIAGVIGKYVVSDSRVIPTKEDLGKTVSEFNIMICDKTFQDMCRMIRDFIVNATNSSSSSIVSSSDKK